jgi:replicative DNA helicase
MQVAEHVAMDHKWFTPEVNEIFQPVIDPESQRPKWIEHRGLPVGVFSLEMSAEELLRRMLFRRSGVDAQRFKTGFASKQDFDRLGKAGAELNKAPIYIDDDDTLTIEALTARARLMVRQHGIKLFVVDYIQCLKVGAKRFRPDRVQEMAEISSGLRSLGKRLGVPFVVLAQMNRDFAKEKGIRKPRLEDLRDCGAIEQDAHVVMFLYEDDSGGESAQEQFEAEVAQVFGTDRKGDWSAMPRRMKILVAKNRHGMNNKDASVLFDGSCARFYDYYDWKKQHGLKEPARGERSPEREEML